ncbi:MAG: helix-turn-helix domain-containing protein [Propionibacteriaceae bacterium]|jgi:excisionase family DNA binding protein|nr:helix-turn-helix domain-containing protein [Propionibacteriaceae bacterium]
MPGDVLTLEPEVLASDQPDALWVEELVAFARQAGKSGETITVSSRPKMMTPAEVAVRLNMSRSTVSRKIAAGEIHSVMVGSHHRIPYQEFRRVWEEMMHTMAKLVAEDIRAELFDD